MDFSGAHTAANEVYDPNYPNQQKADDHTGDGVVTGAIGDLVIDYLPNFSFKTDAVSAGTKTYALNNKKPFIQLTYDAASYDGWQLQVGVSPLTSTDGKDQLTGAQIEVGGSNVINQTGDNSTPAPTALNVTIPTNNQSATIFTAPAGTGMSTWQDYFSASDTKLRIYGGTAKANVHYTGTVQWYLINGEGG
ncbi:WxL domain-containing protein [Furfurilactobacillus entadae]|uniref:WxL domain-containing protein n=1 Tax=Furfurilactobacillus entadae TaxID=2922307 RepID=UPI0038B2E2CB